jgi:hypothetical protein
MVLSGPPEEVSPFRLTRRPDRGLRHTIGVPTGAPMTWPTSSRTSGRRSRSQGSWPVPTPASSRCGRARDDLPRPVRLPARFQGRQAAHRPEGPGAPPARRPLPNKIKNMVLLAQRPAEVNERGTPGDWEGDLISGRGQGSAIGTLVEGSIRYVIFIHLPAAGRRPSSPTRSSPRRRASRTSCAAPSPGTRAGKWPCTRTSPPSPASGSASTTRTRPGSAEQ